MVLSYGRGKPNYDFLALSCLTGQAHFFGTALGGRIGTSYNSAWWFVRDGDITHWKVCEKIFWV